ncbi:DUF1629 domain-containing protein [uncultured Nonlabens sp.]|uniref:imm11 family protein n=1 Tax=uncultured Nonlabens sp. TaxID=859306 RepID=UPI002638E5ED|nr:DUF1629 domain-containing protein [uncultured Nonlabens sp.]
MDRTMYWILKENDAMSDYNYTVGVPDGIDMLEWFSGKSIPSLRVPVNMTLKAGASDYRGDIMGGMMTLYSKELLIMLQEFGVDNVQYRPVDLLDPDTNETEYGYFLVNIVGLIECVKGYDHNAKPLDRPTSLEKFTIDPEKAGDAAIFRLAESPRLVIINDELKNYLVDNGLSGAILCETDEYTIS